MEPDGTSVIIRWDAWDINIDYGTGPAGKYGVYYAKAGESLELCGHVYGTEKRIDDLEKETEYVFAISVFRNIDSILTEGVLTPEESARTGCGSKLP